MSAEQWYATWFDTPWYHQLYAHRNDVEAQRFITKLAQFIGLRPGQKVLDAACGKGRHARILHQLGMVTDAYDLSSASIAEARAQPAEGLCFYVHDMLTPFSVGGYDAVFNLFSSFGYFEDDTKNRTALESMICSVKPGGYFVLDYLNPEFVVKHLVPKEIINRGEVQYHIRRRIENGYVVKDIDFLAAGVHHEYQERVRLINYSLFREWLQQAGTAVSHVFGDYHLGPFISGQSDRMIFVCRKDV